MGISQPHGGGGRSTETHPQLSNPTVKLKGPIPWEDEGRRLAVTSKSRKAPGGGFSPQTPPRRGKLGRQGVDEIVQKENAAREERRASYYGPTGTRDFKDGQRQGKEGMIREEGRGPGKQPLCSETGLFSTT